jgi:hypothetical protein
MSSWARTLLLGNIGQKFDIDDIESDMARLRSRLEAKSTTDESQDEALITLKREVADLKLVVSELVRLLVAGGTVSADAVDRLVRGLETPNSR